MPEYRCSTTFIEDASGRRIEREKCHYRGPNSAINGKPIWIPSKLDRAEIDRRQRGHSDQTVPPDGPGFATIPRESAPEVPVIIRKGQIVVPTVDEYSDHTFLGVFHAAVDFDSADVLERYLDAHPAQRDDYAFEEGTFVQWALTESLLEPAGALEWHLASSGQLNQSQGVREIPIGHR